MFKLKKIMKSLFWALLLFPSVAFASMNDTARLWNGIFGKLLDTLNNVSVIILVLGGFGLVVIAVEAILGKISWKKAAYLGFGLVIVACPLSLVSQWLEEDMGGTVAQLAMRYDLNPDIGGATVTPSD